MRILVIFFFIILLGCKSEEPQNIIPNSSTKIVEVKSKTGRIWMDRNLGATQAATSSADEKSFGDLYQWGRLADGHQLRTSATTNTLSNTDVPLNSSFIIPLNTPWGWRNPPNKNLWQGVNGINNVCPAGFRLPTKEEWRIEISSWESNNAAGAYASPLKLPMAGHRWRSSMVDSVGLSGKYWSSTLSTEGSSNYINLQRTYVDDITFTSPAPGFSVRCIKD